MRRTIILTLICCISLIGGLVCAQESPHEHKAGIYYTLINETTNALLLETGIPVVVDDQFIDEDNKLYQVSRVEGYTAYAHYIRDETHSIDFEGLAIPTANGVDPGRLISLYHSHTDEAYTPTDGKPSIRGDGSIKKVGERFAEKLRAMGYSVNHDITLHDPHDANAYIRSRRTAIKLLGQQPVALFDIHRNSAPAAGYKLTLDGQQVAKAVIVVGRANPLMPTTLDFAKQLKAAADAQHPKLVRGIFFAQGHYNQDLNPRSILVEVGTEGSTLAEAQNGIAMFADAIPAVLGGTQETATDAGTTAQAAPPAGGGGLGLGTGNSTAWRNVIGIAGITVLGGIAYLFLSAGSWKAVRQKLSQFRNLEFANLLGIRPRRKKDGSDKE
jgi:stage II sporulation protein P